MMMGRFGKKGRYSCFGFLAVLFLLLPYAMARGKILTVYESLMRDFSITSSDLGEFVDSESSL